MTMPLMPKATAVWLVENTSLTFEQIADFCGLHALEIQAIADDEVAIGMQGMDPIANGELTQEELERCMANPRTKLKPAKPTNPVPKARTKGARYTPVSKRQDRPDAIAWLLKNYPELSDGQISKLLGTTKIPLTRSANVNIGICRTSSRRTLSPWDCAAMKSLNASSRSHAGVLKMLPNVPPKKKNNARKH